MVRSIPLRHTVDVLSSDELARVLEASESILATTGVRMTSESTLLRLAESGAQVDLGEQLVRFPARLVEEAVRGAPRAPPPAGRPPELDLVLDGTRGYLSVDGCAAEILDLDTGERRPSTGADLAAITRIADSLPEISFVWQGVAARDVPAGSAPLHELRIQLSNTSKHIQMMTATTPSIAATIVEMARVVAGGAEALRARPIVSAFQCSISPLTYDAGPIEAALVYAEAGVPCGFVVMPIAGATAPATVAGTLALANAEVLAGIVTLGLLVPGAPTFYGACPTTMDISTGAATCGGPEDLFFQLACAQIARSYGLRSSIGTFATGSKASDWQSGTENALSGMASALGGADMFCGAGLLHGARVHSSAQMVLDAEVFDLLCHLFGGYGFDEDALALGTTDGVGPSGHFLASEHTLSHMRELWRPRSFDRDTWEGWEATGKPSPYDSARERAKGILAEHAPTPVPDGVDAELRSIIERHVLAD